MRDQKCAWDFDQGVQPKQRQLHTWAHKSSCVIGESASAIGTKEKSESYGSNLTIACKALRHPTLRLRHTFAA